MQNLIKNFFLLAVIIVTFYRYFIHTPLVAYPLGITELSVIDTTRVFDNKPREILALIWYPAQKGVITEKIEYDIWKIKDAAKNGSPLGGKKLPLILFSHGYSGHPYANSWFAEYLASGGYIVASVLHYGNSFPQSMIPEISARPWNRPKDMSVLLDYLLENPVWKERIDSTKIGAAGFSQGGVASLWLAGIRAHLTKDILKEQITFIDNPFLREKHFKGLPKERLDSVLSQFTSKDFEEANQSYRDTRIKAVCALAPGIDEKNPMFLQEGLSGVNIPVSIIVGQGDDVETSRFFAQHIPTSRLSILPGKVTHWTLLNEATEQGKKINPFITVDDQSIKRAKVHDQVGSMVLDFFNDTLKNR